MDKPAYESFRANEFTLEIDGLVSPSISKVSGLSEGEIETVEQPDGGSNHVYKLAGGKVKFDPLTIERYVDGGPGDEDFKDWWQETFNRFGGAEGSSLRKSGMVHKYHNGERVLTFAFFDAWIKSSKFTDLEAGSTGLFKQTIVLEHEGLERVD